MKTMRSKSTEEEGELIGDGFFSIDFGVFGREPKSLTFCAQRPWVHGSVP